MVYGYGYVIPSTGLISSVVHSYIFLTENVIDAPANTGTQPRTHIYIMQHHTHTHTHIYICIHIILLDVAGVLINSVLDPVLFHLHRFTHGGVQPSNCWILKTRSSDLFVENCYHMLLIISWCSLYRAEFVDSWQRKLLSVTVSCRTLLSREVSALTRVTGIKPV